MLGSMMGTLQKDLETETAARRSEHEHLVRSSCPPQP